MSEHRASMLGGSLRRYEDPAQSRDPRIREIVSALATLEPAPAPRAHFRAELRAQLVAVAPRLVQESATEDVSAARATETPTKHRTAASLLAGLRLSRPLAAVACTVVVLAMLLAGAVVASRNALPGDALYGVKRASENAQYALAQSSSARARLSLSFAGTRISEVQALLPRGTGPATVSPNLTGLVDSTLASANTDVIRAAQTLGEQAVQNNSAAPLQSMTTWAPIALGQLSAIINRLPGGTAHDQAQASYTLVGSAMARAAALQAEAGCSCLHSTGSDRFGPLPCPVCNTAPGSTNGTLPGTTIPSTGSTKPGTGSITGGTGTGQSGLGNGVTTPPVGTGDGDSAQPTKPTIPFPTVSVPQLPSVSVGPIGVGSCGISISLSPINLHLGTCTPSHS